MTQPAALPVFPLHLLMTGRRAVVVGGGRIAARKAGSLLDAGADVLVISPILGPALRAPAAHGRIRWLQRSYRSGDLAGAWLCVAATDRPAVNAAVMAEAERLRIFAVRTDAGGLGSARSPAVVRTSDAVIGLSSESVARIDPRRVAQLRNSVAGLLSEPAPPHR